MCRSASRDNGLGVSVRQWIMGWESQCVDGQWVGCLSASRNNGLGDLVRQGTMG